MKNRLKLWDNYSDWETADRAWEERAEALKKARPLKTIGQMPNVPGITPETARHLKWKSLKYLIQHDHPRLFRRYFFKRPFKYTWSLLQSLFKQEPYKRDEDFFLYGIPHIDAFQRELEDPNSLLVVGFSYCHKPFECPSGRFTDQCIHDAEHPACRQCFIGKAVHALPEKATLPFFIPTIHYIGEKIFEVVHQHPDKNILFLITACEMTLKMFGDWGNMVHIKGVGVRLDGRICNTMKAFELSETGIKPGLTVVLPQTQQRILDLIRHRRSYFHNDASGGTA